MKFMNCGAAGLTMGLPLILFAASLYGQQPNAGGATPVTVGTQWSMHSSALNEDRTISVHFPQDYDQSTARYPVLYMLDGDQAFVMVSGVAEALPWARRAPELIVVAIHNIHRTHDFTTPWTSAVSPGQAQWMVDRAGGADRFLAFLKTELLPEIDRRYRTAPFRILLGHSLGGLFALHVLAAEPDMFSAIIALSPPAFWNDDEVVHGAVRLFSERHDLKGYLFVDRAAKEFDDTPGAVEKMGEALRLRAPVSLHWKTQAISDEDHGTAFLPGAQAGLEFVFTGWRLPQLVFDEGLESSERYYDQRSAEYGFRVVIPEGEISALAARARGPETSLRIYKRYSELYPESVTAFAGLAGALETSGHLRAANDAYAKAVALAVADNDPRAAELKQRQESLIARLKDKP